MRVQYDLVHGVQSRSLVTTHEGPHLLLVLESSWEAAAAIYHYECGGFSGTCCGGKFGMCMRLSFSGILKLRRKLWTLFTNSLKKISSAGSDNLEPIHIEWCGPQVNDFYQHRYIQRLSLRKPTLKVVPVNRSCLLVAHISKCEHATVIDDDVHEVDHCLKRFSDIINQDPSVPNPNVHIFGFS